MNCSAVVQKSVAISQKAWKQLFRGAQQGSQKAITRLYEITEPSIKTLANGLGKSQQAKEDLFIRGCEVFMETISRQKEAVKKPQNYLVKCIYSQMLSLREAVAKHAKRFVSLEQAAPIESGSPSGIGTIIKNLKDPKKMNMPNYAAVVHEMREMILKLPRKQKEVLLGIIEGRDYSEIAKKLGTSENNVAQIFRRTKKQLEKMMKS